MPFLAEGVLPLLADVKTYLPFELECLMRGPLLLSTRYGNLSLRSIVYLRGNSTRIHGNLTGGEGFTSDVQANAKASYLRGVTSISMGEVQGS